jgi:hypothetical protein
VSIVIRIEYEKLGIDVNVPVELEASDCELGIMSPDNLSRGTERRTPI